MCVSSHQQAGDTPHPRISLITPPDSHPATVIKGGTVIGTFSMISSAAFR